VTDELKILSAGAVKPGLTKVIDAFQRDSGTTVQISFATAPAILKQLGAGEIPDVVIAPADVVTEITRSEKCAMGITVVVGQIGVGVFVRNGEPLPQIGTVEGFKESLLGVESVVYNQASTGTYLEALFESLGIGAAIRGKSTRYPDFAAVLDHVSKGMGREIGLGATTVIIENEKRGVRFAGPLPAEIQNYTFYVAAITAESNTKETAQQFMTYLASPAAKSLLTAAGIQ
jgi:molybdate transport system substrate-binding protein